MAEKYDPRIQAEKEAELGLGGADLERRGPVSLLWLIPFGDSQTCASTSASGLMLPRGRPRKRQNRQRLSVRSLHMEETGDVGV